MWKKILIVLLGLVGAFSVVYADNLSQDLYAASPASLTGRMGELQKGDTVLMEGGKDANGSLGWKLLVNTKNSANPIDNGWFAMANRPIARTKLIASGTTRTTDLYTDTLLPNYIAQLNATFTSNDLKIINPRYHGSAIDAPFWYSTTGKAWLGGSKTLMEYIEWSNELDKAFIPVVYELRYNPTDTLTSQKASGIGASTQDLAFTEEYYAGSTGSSAPSNRDKWMIFQTDGTNPMQVFGTTAYAVRPAIYFDLDKKNTTVFSLANGYSSGMSNVDVPVAASYDHKQSMKLRLLDTQRSVEMDSITADHKGVRTKVTEIANKQTIYIKYKDVIEPSGEAGKISLLVQDSDGNLAYYMQLASSDASIPSEGFAVNLDLAPDDYQFYVVNEVLTTDDSPTYSSALSSPISLSVKDELSVSVTPTPQGQATFEYSKNVRAQDQVASIQLNGGVNPITYTLASDTTAAGHANDYLKFSIDKDAQGSLIVKVSDQNGLEAGDYYFKVHVIDDHGHPTNGVTSASVKIEVNRTSPNLVFTNNQATLYKIITDAPFDEAFTHKNTDAYTLTYTSTLPAVANVNAWSQGLSDITISPGSTAGTTTITVDMPATKNFNAESISKTVKIFPQLNLSFQPKSASIAVNDVVNAGTVVGNISLIADSPDYTYSMGIDPTDSSAAANNALFEPNILTATSSKSINLVTKQANLPQGTYAVTIKVTDPYGQAAYAKGTIHIAGTAQTGFDFYDYNNTSTILTNKTLTVYYGETKAKLIAKGGQSINGITYKLEDGEPTTILQIDPSQGDITIQDVGAVKVKAIKAGDNTYHDAVIQMDVKVEPCDQEIVFTNPNTTVIMYDAMNGNTIQEKVIARIAAGMPNEGSSGVGNITYKLDGVNASIANVDAQGNITIAQGQTITGKQTFSITATITDPLGHYETKSVMKTIDVYPPGSISWNQTATPKADANAVDDKVGDVSVSGGTGSVSFSIPAKSSVNPDADYFKIDPNTGEVTIKQQIDHNTLSTKLNTATNQYEMQIVVEVQDGGNITSEAITIVIEGADRIGIDFKNRDGITQEITEVYDTNKSFQLALTQTIIGVSYRESTNPLHPSPQDVVSLDANTQGKVNILNANEISIAGSSNTPYYVEAVIPQKDGFCETILEAPIRIKRADQQLSFSQNPINTSVDIQSLNISISGHMDSKPILYTSSDSNIDVNADSTDPNQVIIKPNGYVMNGIFVSAVAQGDRNYNDTKEDAVLNIAAAGTQQFSAVFPSMTYGDAGPFSVSIVPAGDGSEAYTYNVKDTSILDIDVNGNITIHRAGTTSVDITKTSSGGVIGPYTFNVTVKPRPITITVDDEVKYVGMSMPTFHANIPALVGNDSLPQPDFSCKKMDGSNVDKNTIAGTYDIIGSYQNPNPNYKITIVNGSLTIQQDMALSSWYYFEDAAGSLTTNTKWHRDNIDVVISSNSTASAGSYDQIANNTSFSNPDLTRFTVTDEGETIQDIYFRIDPNGSDPNKGAVSLPIQETIRIDNTDPVITSIVGKNAPNSKLRELLNTLTFGKYFKQGMVITIHAEDVEPQPGVVVSGIQKITYTINKVDAQGNPIGTPNTVNQSDETVEVSIQEAGNYKVCAKATDQAGNEGSNTCEEFDIRKIDVDVDKDGKPDFNDPDGNGCADFNIVYTDEATGEQKVLNVDANRDGIPEMNIDTNGDGEADINVDTDGDGKPDLNLVHMTKELWKPTMCVTQHGEQYESGMDITPQINVDLDIYDSDSDSYHVPDINIDHKGDFQPHINISKDGKTAQVNIAIIHTWNPNKDYTVDGFSYDTLTVDEKKEILMNIDTDGDGRPDINIDLNNDGKPDLNIDTDGDWIPNINIDSIGDGKADINIDTTKDGKPDINVIEIKEWTPKKDVDGKVPYDTMEITGKKELEDNGIIVEKPDGNFLPNTAIKVKDVSDTVDTSIKEKLDSLAGEQEIKKVYDVEYLENNVTKQPNGSVKVKIPVDPLVKNAKVVVEKEDGNFEEVNVTEKDGYYIFETEYIGKVSIIGDVEETKYPTPEPTPEPMPDSSIKHKENPSTSVKGSYTKNTSGVGGAYTGDSTHEIYYYAVIIILSFCILLCVEKRIKNK